MLIRPLLALTLFGAFCGFVSAAPGVAASAPPESGANVRAWLLRIHEAAGKRNFQGTFVVSGGGSVSSARIAHYCVGTQQYERIESLDGQARQVFRHNDVVQTVWPITRVAVVEQTQLPRAFPSLLLAGDERVAEFYDLQPQGAGRVAGHEADVLLLQPRDQRRFGYRLWAERGTGLLLRADVLNDKAEVLETTAFSEVTIGVRAQPDAVLQPMRRLDGYRVLRPQLQPALLEDEGWALRELVPGFRFVSGFRRPIGAAAGGEGDAPAAAVFQAIYSDGLTHVSLFIEPYDQKLQPRDMRAALGATQTLMRRYGDWWVTLVGDVPLPTLKDFAKGLERRK